MALVALGVSGGISAYKAVEVCRGLQKRGHDVTAILTHSAAKFIGPVTFEAITRRRVITDQWETGANADIEHIALASDAKLLLVTPATAHLVARFAHGLADDFLTSLYLATRAPVMIAPAMNTHMLTHPATQQNLEVLRQRGVHIVEPGEGYLACGWTGKGRLPEPDDIVEAADRLLRPKATLEGRTVVVTAGPTYEDLDPVRYLGNRSSGRMGIAIAQDAVQRGARVVLVLGPTSVPVPGGIEVVRVRSAAEMHDAVFAQVDAADVVVMAAAVADYTPAGGAAAGKVAKQPGGMDLELVRTKDILAGLGAWRAGRTRPLLVGFAAETHDVVTKAREKLGRKGVDMIVANDVSRPDAGFEVETNAATIVTTAGEETLPLQRKTTLAAQIVDRIEARLAPSAHSVGTAGRSAP